MDLLELFSNNVDYHQTTAYADVMSRIGWDVIPVGGSFLFVRRAGPVSFAKFQRPNVINLKELVALQKRLHIVQLYLEPGLATDTKELASYGFVPTSTHHAYTKTFVCDISGTE